MCADRDPGQPRHHDHDHGGDADDAADGSRANDAGRDEEENAVEDHRAAGVATRKSIAIGKLGDLNRIEGRPWAVEEQLQASIEQAQRQGDENQQRFGAMPRQDQGCRDANGQQGRPRQRLPEPI